MAAAAPDAPESKEIAEALVSEIISKAADGMAATRCENFFFTYSSGLLFPVFISCPKVVLVRRGPGFDPAVTDCKQAMRLALSARSAYFTPPLIYRLVTHKISTLSHQQGRTSIKSNALTLFLYRRQSL